MPNRDAAFVDASVDVEQLEQDNRILRERLAFYEGFDRLIQDNVSHARELFRLASQERESTSAEVERAERAVADREANLLAELEAIAQEAGTLATAVDALLRRIALAQGTPAADDGGAMTPATSEAHSFAVVAHGVSSARSARSLQQFVASLPQVAGVTAREFAGGVLRLDARVRDPLLVDQFRRWDTSRPIESLTERPDVVEFALGNGSR